VLVLVCAKRQVEGSRQGGGSNGTKTALKYGQISHGVGAEGALRAHHPEEVLIYGVGIPSSFAKAVGTTWDLAESLGTARN